MSVLGAQEHLTGLASWTPPAAGMFLWLRLHGVACADAILARLQAEKVVVVPGAPAPAWCMRLCSNLNTVTWQYTIFL